MQLVISAVIGALTVEGGPYVPPTMVDFAETDFSSTDFA